MVAGVLLWLSPPPPLQVQRETAVFGTRAVITINGMEEEKAAKIIAEVFAHFQQMHNRFHPWQPGELTTINNAIKNNNYPITISAEMKTMLTLAAAHSQQTEYLFNPAIGALISLWGFHQNKTQTPPDLDTIKSYAADIPSLEAMTIKDNKIITAHPKTQLDFGAIAKGAALDAARDILKTHRVKDALINVGGNILALGNNNGNPWRAGLSKGGKGKDGKKIFATIPLHDGEALSISGGGEQNYDYKGKKYHHIINPQTATPAKNAALAAVISNNKKNAGSLSDSCTTALIIANKQQTPRILKNCQTQKALQIIQTPTITTTITTPQMSKRLQQ